VGAKDLVMLDEDGMKEEVEKNIIIVIMVSNNCTIKGKIVTMPIDEALSIAANIAVQVSMII